MYSAQPNGRSRDARAAARPEIDQTHGELHGALRLSAGMRRVCGRFGAGRAGAIRRSGTKQAPFQTSPDSLDAATAPERFFNSPASETAPQNPAASRGTGVKPVSGPNSFAFRDRNSNIDGPTNHRFNEALFEERFKSVFSTSATTIGTRADGAGTMDAVSKIVPGGQLYSVSDGAVLMTFRSI
jgi:hypothetical protein